MKKSEVKIAFRFVLQLHPASQHQAARALNCFCEHLCFISIHFQLLATYVLRYQRSPRAHKGVMLSVKLDVDQYVL